MSSIIKTRRFLPLMITQFLGALNDNLFKNALLTLVTLKMAEQSDVLSNVIAGLFILPFFLFSAWAGEFADKYDRSKIAQNLKIMEIVLMIGVGVAYYYSNLTLLIILMALMGTQSAFFGPVKYALLPQQLKTEELITGNAYIEATTYIAILGGLITGTLLPIEFSIIVLIFLAVCGYLASRKILPAPAPRPDVKINKNLFTAMLQNYIFLRKHPYILQSILGASWFWTIGALVAVQIYPLCGKVLNAAEGTITFFLVLFSLGVAFGSYICNQILKGEINMIYVPLSAIGMAFCLFSLWILSADYPTPEKIMNFTDFLTAPKAFGFSVSLFMLAFWGGLYIIPLNAFMQHRAPKAYTASVIAGNNIINSLGMTGSAVFAIILFKLGFTLPQLFMIMGIISLMVALYICSLLPDTLTRSLLQTILRFMFRTKVTGFKNFKKAGSKVLIIANHTSLWDGVIMAAFMPERITFAITSAWTGKWFMPIIRLLVDFYPLDPSNPLSIRNLIEEIKKGRKVMIFPEGRITLTGKLMQVYDGAAMIAAKANAKLLPVRISGAQYSKLSYVQDKFYTRLFPKIDLHILPSTKFEVPLNKNSRNAAAKKLYELMVDMVLNTSDVEQTLFEALEHASKNVHKKHIIATDIMGYNLSYKDLIKKAISYGQSLSKILSDKQQIGICIPAGLNFLVTFWALQYLSKSVVIISPNDINEQVSQAGVEVLLSVKDFEDVSCDLINISTLKPVRFAYKYKKQKTKTKVVLFKNKQMFECTSKDILKSFKQLDCIFPFNTKDVAINTLPSDSAEGFVLGTILPILSGVKTCFAPNLSAKFVSRLCYDMASTVMILNDSDYVESINNSTAFDFFNVRLAFCVGQKLENSVLEYWLKNFNVRILESFTPQDSVFIATINTPLYYKFGSLGSNLFNKKTIFDEVYFDENGFAFMS